MSRGIIANVRLLSTQSGHSLVLQAHLMIHSIANAVKWFDSEQDCLWLVP